MSDLLKKTRDSLNRSFLVSDLSDSLTSLIKKEGTSKWLVFKKLSKNVQKNMILVKFV